MGVEITRVRIQVVPRPSPEPHEPQSLRDLAPADP